MKTSANKELSPELTKILSGIGARIRQARLRRGITQDKLSNQVNCTMVTLAKVEKGDSSVSMGTYARVLECLQLEEGLTFIAKNDTVGYELLDAMLPRRIRGRKPKEAKENAE